MAEKKSRLVIEIDSSQALRSAQAVNKELISIRDTGNYASKSMDSLSVATRTLAGHMAGFLTVGTAIGKMDAFTGLQNRLKLVTNSQTELNKAMQDTFNIAQNTRQSWESAAQVYQGFANNAKALGLTMSKTAQLTETVSKAVAISGSSTQASEAALIQFNQALSSGTLRGEELNSVMEQTPGLAKAIAEGMGITVGQLRSVAAEGKITSSVLVDALTKSKNSVDNLFSKTDVTIGQSLTMLNNELGKFIGEAGQGSGAAKTLADSLQFLSQNLSPLADGAMVVGIGYLTKSMLEKSIATRAAIVGSIQNQAAMIAEKTASVELAGIEALRARQNAALAAQEVRSAELALANAKSKDAQALATQRLAAAEVAHGIAAKEASVATAQYTVAQDVLNKSKSLGSTLLALVGGPIGALTVAAMGLGAGYMYLQKKADEANKKIAEQAEVAKRTKEELLALKGLEKDDAIDSMTQSFKRQNEALSELSTKVNIQLDSIGRLYKGNKEIVKVVQDAKDGTISMGAAVKRFNELRLNRDIYNSLKENVNGFEENTLEAKRSKESLALYGVQVKLSGVDAQTGAVGIQENTNKLRGNEEAARDAAKAQKGYFDSLGQEVLTANIDLQYVKMGYSSEVVKRIHELEKTKQAVAPKGTDVIITQAEIDKIVRSVKSIESVKETENAILEAKRKQTREAEKQAKLQEKLLANGNRLVGISGNTGIGRAHVDIRYGGSRDGQKPSAEHINRIQAGGKSLQSYGMTSGYGARNLKDPRASKFHKGIDFAVPKGTLLTTKVAVKSIDKKFDPNGGGYVSTITFEDGVVLKLLHQSKEMMGKVSGGSSDGSKNSRTYAQQERDEVQFAKEGETLQADYYTIAQKDKADHEKRMADLKKHGLTKEMEMEKARYEKTKELRALEQILDVDGWRWVGEEKIKNDAAINKLRIEASMDFDAKTKAEKIKSIDEQRDYELSAYRRLQQEKMKEFRAVMEQQTAEYQKAYYETLAKASMPQPAYDRWNAQNSYSDQMGAAWDNKQKAFDEADKKDSTTDQFLNDEITRNQMRVKAEAEYQATILAIKQKGLLDEKALRDQQYADNLSVYGSMFGGMANLMKGYVGESSGAYKTLFFMQKSFALAQAGMNVYKAASDAYANEPGTIWQKIGAATLATVESGALLSLIQAATPQGFATGGPINGAGTGTSDSIPIMASNGEFMVREFAASKLGLETLNYINRTGELPYQKYQEQLLLQQANHNPIMKGFATGGYIGTPQQSSPMVERQRLIAMRESNVATRDSEPTVTIHQTITFDTSNGEAKIDASGQKAIAESLNNVMSNWFRRESMQGGQVYNAMKRIK